MSEEFALLQLACGETNIDLLEPPYSYRSASFAPSVSYRSDEHVGGSRLFTEMPEAIGVDIYGASASDPLEGLDDLAWMLDCADAWAKDYGSNRDPVILKVRAQGSSLADPLQVLIVGRTGDNSLMQLPVTFNDTLAGWSIDGATITFRRRGQLLGAVDTAVSAAADNGIPAILTMPNGAVRYPSPTKISLTDFLAGTELLGSGYLLVSGAAQFSAYGTNFATYGANSFSGSGWAEQTETTYLAKDGKVKRIDASSNTSGTLTISDVGVDYEIVHVFVKLRNNNATNWLIRPRSTGFMEAAAGWLPVGTDSTAPQVIALGMLFSAAGQHTDIHVDVQTNGSSGTLDVESITIMAQDDDAQYITIQGKTYSTAAFVRNFIVDPRELSHREALAYIETKT